MRSWKLYAVIALVAAGFVVACTGGNTTGESPAVNTVTGGSALTSSSAPAAASPITQAEPEIFANIESDGTVFVNNHSSTDWTAAVLYFVNGPHPQTKLYTGLYEVPAGATKSFPLPEDEIWTEYATKIGMPKTTCEPQKLDLELQIDGVKFINRNNPSNNLGPTWGVVYRTLDKEVVGDRSLCCVDTPVWTLFNTGDQYHRYYVVGNNNLYYTVDLNPGQKFVFTGHANETLQVWSSWFWIPIKVAQASGDVCDLNERTDIEGQFWRKPEIPEARLCVRCQCIFPEKQPS